MRGYWFVDASLEPLDDAYVDVIEKEHVALFEHELLSKCDEFLPECRTKSTAG